MDTNWNDREPIYLQIRERIVRLILSGGLVEEQQLPSVRRVATEYQVNPLTVMKAYQMLVDEEVVEKRRGRGMFVRIGAWQHLLEGERRRFLEDEWPRVLQRIRRLGLDPEELPRPADAAAESTIESAMEERAGTTSPLPGGGEGDESAEADHPAEEPAGGKEEANE